MQVHPDARCYRTKPVLNFDDLCVIYGSTIADGKYSLSSHDASLDDEVQRLHLSECCFLCPLSYHSIGRFICALYIH